MDGFLNEEKPNNSNNNANPPITLFGNHLWPKDQQQVIADELNVILESDEISWRPQGADPVPYIEGFFDFLKVLKFFFEFFKFL